MSDAFIVAVLGAESTGKTTLARDLAPALQAQTGLAATWVPEALRAWCAQAGRTPRPEEQAAIARTQHEHIAAAAQRHAIVVCDTTAVMTAVYSQWLFDDHGLEAWAAQAHATVSATLVTALDLPWEADGLQRDGPHVRGPVDGAVRALLARHGIAFHEVAGQGPWRLACALAALQSPLERWRVQSR